jgi:hypothetical protein
MTQSFIAYNETKLKELDAELTQIKEDSKLPVKLFDSEGKIKKVLLEKSFNFTKSGSPVIIYLKFPLSTSSLLPFPSVLMNFSILMSHSDMPTNNTSYFKSMLYFESDIINVEIDSSLNHGQLVISDKKIVYYTDGEINHYYLKLSIQNLGAGTKYFDVNYTDMSSNIGIPADFIYDNMILNVLPEAEQIYANTNIINTNVFVDFVKLGNGARTGIITNNSLNNPGVTHAHLYPDSSSKWSTPTQIGTSDLDMWTYTP